MKAVSYATGGYATEFRRLSDASFSMRLEKHLDDYRRGRGNLSLDVAADLGIKHSTTGDALAHRDPTSLIRYGAYSTVMSYDKRARFVNGVNSAVEAVQSILA